MCPSRGYSAPSVAHFSHHFPYLPRLNTEKVAAFGYIVFAKDDSTEYYCEVLGIHLVLLLVRSHFRQVFNDGLECCLMHRWETAHFRS